jgi:amidase
MSMAFGVVAIGTETSGSIIAPSYINGVVGIKPTLGLTSRAGVIPLAPQFDVTGPIARSVTDAAIVLDAIGGEDPEDSATSAAGKPQTVGALKKDALKGARLAYSQSAYDNMADGDRALFDESLKRLHDQGAETIGVRALDANVVGLTELGAIPNSFKASLNEYLQTVKPPSGVKTLADIVAFNEQHPDKVKYGQNLLVASNATPGVASLAVAQSLPTVLAARDVILAALIEADADAIISPDLEEVNLGAAAGHPTVIVPSAPANRGRAQHGLAFLGRRFEEFRLVGYAYAFEQSGPRRIPPTDVNSRLVPQSCPAEPKAKVLPAKARVTHRGRLLTVRITNGRGKTVKVVVRRGASTVARRSAKLRSGKATLRIRLRRAGRYRVVVSDGGGRVLSRTVRV